MVKVSWFVFVQMFVVTGTIGLSSTRLGNVLVCVRLPVVGWQ